MDFSARSVVQLGSTLGWRCWVIRLVHLRIYRITTHYLLKGLYHLTYLSYIHEFVLD